MRSRGSRAGLSEVLAHISRTFPHRKLREFAWREGPILRSFPGFRVVRVAPREPSDPWVYVSMGASAVAHEGAHRLEFFIMAPDADPIHVRTLAMMANYHADPATHLYEGRVLDLAFPWVDGSSCDHVLLSAPYLVGPGFARLALGDLHVRFLWLLPITAGEARYARERGVERLEGLLEDAAVDVFDPFRVSVVT